MDVVHDRGLRESKKAATRRALARAVLRLSSTTGIDQVTIDAVAAEAGVSVRTFHNYFSGKEDALPYYVSSLLDEVADTIDACPPESTLWDAMRESMTDIACASGAGEQSEFVTMFRLLDTEPSLIAHSNTIDLPGTAANRLAETFRRRGEDEDSLYAHLVCGAAIATVRTALDFWARSDRPRELRRVLDAAFAQTASGLAQPLRQTEDI